MRQEGLEGVDVLLEGVANEGVDEVVENMDVVSDCVYFDSTVKFV